MLLLMLVLDLMISAFRLPPSGPAPISVQILVQLVIAR